MPRKNSRLALKEVLAILAVLIVFILIFYPGPGHNRENARRASCQSNLKQLGLAFIQYTQDSDNTYPPGQKSSGQG